LTECWYGIRTKPGTQRVASADDTLPEARKEEFVVERQCRDEGFEVFTPSYFVTTKHARTNKILVKRIPLFGGYAFVNLPGQQFEQLRNEVDGVLGILRTSTGPFRFPSRLIDQMIVDDWKARQDALSARHHIREGERHDEIKHLRGQLRKILPKGRAVRVNMVAQADKVIGSMPRRARERVETILQQLNG
jgi:hypothetical protein